MPPSETRALLLWPVLLCGLLTVLNQTALAASPAPVVISAAPVVISAAPVVISAAPGRPILETRGASKFLNFDMMVRNQGDQTLRISKIEMSAYDAGHHLALRKALNTDAFAPSIAVIGDQMLTPGKTLDIFNPFPEFDAAVPVDTLQYAFCLQRETTAEEKEKNLHRLPDDCDFINDFTVTPRLYAGKTPLALPLKGKVFVWEGHDYYAHHLRVPMSNPKVAAMGITANSNEFAMDFIYTDEAGREYKGDPQKKENWPSYGKPIFAPGAGVVREAVNDIPDNWFKDAAVTKIGHPDLPPGKDPKDIGNYVLIDHGNGEFSLLVHMKPGSVAVKAGDRIAQGQKIGEIGFAGDSLFPHLHYSLIEGAEDTKVWGLPAYFSRFHRLYGAKSVAVAKGPVNSGDFVESDGTK
ncbi:MAG TPA: M23 family metallopeptidase [Rhizomicrobium sp.]